MSFGIKFKEIQAERTRYSISQSDFLNLGSRLGREGNIEEAIAILNMNIRVFPDSYDSYMVLGRCYRSLGLEEKDLEATNRAFEIRNDNLLREFIAGNEDSIAKSAEEVIHRYLQAIGGKDKLSAIKTMKLTLMDLNAINQEVAIIRYYQYPYFYRQTLVKRGYSTVTNGENVWG